MHLCTVPPLISADFCFQWRGAGVVSVLTVRPLPGLATSPSVCRTAMRTRRRTRSSSSGEETTTAHSSTICSASASPSSQSWRSWRRARREGRLDGTRQIVTHWITRLNCHPNHSPYSPITTMTPQPHPYPFISPHPHHNLHPHTPPNNPSPFPPCSLSLPLPPMAGEYSLSLFLSSSPHPHHAVCQCQGSSDLFSQCVTVSRQQGSIGQLEWHGVGVSQCQGSTDLSASLNGDRSNTYIHLMVCYSVFSWWCLNENEWIVFYLYIMNLTQYTDLLLIIELWKINSCLSTAESDSVLQPWCMCLLNIPVNNS